VNITAVATNRQSLGDEMLWERYPCETDGLGVDAVETSSVIALAAFGGVSRDSGRCLVEGSSHGADGRRNRIPSVAA
jgi:hypothetical protein